MVSNPSNRIKSESIDEVILRLLGLNPGVEIDYQTYHDIIKKKLAIVRLAGKEIPREEDELLREEFKRVRRVKDKGIRFKVKKAKVKTKVSTVSTALNQKSLPGSSALVKPKKSFISPRDIIPVNVEDITERKKDKDQNLSPIRKTLDSILKILESKFKFDKKQTDQERREKEEERRSKRESSLEGFKKGIAGVVSLTKKMLSPFENIIDRIKRFIFFTLLGRAFTKFMEWMNDKGNQEKFNSFIEFLTDHWPALAGLYILFGTSFGKLVRGLLKGATRMIIALARNVGKIRKFIGKHKKLAFLGFALAPIASRELGNILGENKETPESGLIPQSNPELTDAQKTADQAKQTNVPKFNLGGMVPKFNFGGMIPSFAMGAMNPFGGMDLQSGVPISGAGKDDTLIAAKTGEAILTEKDQADLSQRYVDSTTGQPLNIPQYLAGRKPGLVNLGNLRFPGFGGGFFNGGMIPKFNVGGIVGGFSSGNNQFGETPLIRTALSSGIKGPELAAFLAQMSHETGGFKWSRELGRGKGMGYSGGSRYHGRGYTQLTHDYNYEKFGKKLGVDLIKDPDLLLKDPNLSARVAVEYWKENVRPKVKDWNDVLSHSAAINYPSATSPNQINGYEDRLNKFNYYKKNLRSIVSRSLPKRQKPQSTKSKPKKNSIFRNFASFMPTSFPFFRGGKIPSVGRVGENEGVNKKGATADRQLFPILGGGFGLLQPGEFVVTNKAANIIGYDILHRINSLDSSSESARLGSRTINVPKITPYNSSGMNQMSSFTLPPIHQSAGGSRARSAGLGGGSEVPQFSAIAPDNERALNASIYGLVA